TPPVMGVVIVLCSTCKGMARLFSAALDCVADRAPGAECGSPLRHPGQEGSRPTLAHRRRSCARTVSRWVDQAGSRSGGAPASEAGTTEIFFGGSGWRGCAPRKVAVPRPERLGGLRARP